MTLYSSSGYYQKKSVGPEAKPYKRVQKAVHFWWKASSFSKAIENFEYDAAGEVDMRHSGWTKMMKDIPRLSQQERM